MDKEEEEEETTVEIRSLVDLVKLATKVKEQEAEERKKKYVDDLVEEAKRTGMSLMEIARARCKSFYVCDKCEGTIFVFHDEETEDKGGCPHCEGKGTVVKVDHKTVYPLQKKEEEEN